MPQQRRASLNAPVVWPQQRSKHSLVREIGQKTAKNRLLVLDQFGPILNPFWTHCGPILDPFRTHFGPILAPFWPHFGPILAPSWPHLGPILAPFWPHFGPILDPFWTHFGPIFGPILGPMLRPLSYACGQHGSRTCFPAVFALEVSARFVLNCSGIFFLICLKACAQISMIDVSGSFGQLAF